MFVIDFFLCIFCSVLLDIVFVGVYEYMFLDGGWIYYLWYNSLFMLYVSSLFDIYWLIRCNLVF